ncbi:hypothetical protein K1719_001103 [Acacia pycnantha]|nr:hypothetical protein K1719_001103 [Acacia pycnantha]
MMMMKKKNSQNCTICFYLSRHFKRPKRIGKVYSWKGKGKGKGKGKRQKLQLCPCSTELPVISNFNGKRKRGGERQGIIPFILDNSVLEALKPQLFLKKGVGEDIEQCSYSAGYVP